MKQKLTIEAIGKLSKTFDHKYVIRLTLLDLEMEFGR